MKYVCISNGYFSGWVAQSGSTFPWFHTGRSLVKYDYDSWKAIWEQSQVLVLCFKSGIWLNLMHNHHQIKNVELRSLPGFNCLPFYPATAVKHSERKKGDSLCLFSDAHVCGQKTSLINSVCHECTQMSVLRCSLLISRGAVDTCLWQTE